MNNKADILIIGGGVTGLATAFALEQRGYIPILAVTAESTSQQAPGLITGGQVDNYTRVAHAHGDQFAASLWGFGNRAFEELLAFCRSYSIPYHQGPRYRLITSEHELKEAALAVKKLTAAGFTATLKTKTVADPLWLGLTDRVLAVQDEGRFGAHIDGARFLERLSSLVKAPRCAAVANLRTTPTGLVATLEDGQHKQIEVAVLACHLKIGELLPNLKSALVSVADQWSEVKAPSRSDHPLWNQPGLVYSANHAYEWGVTMSNGHLIMGGGRYLRPFAGIEATHAPFEETITSHLRQQLKKTFAWGSSTTTTGVGAAALDCRPCDELPIIGPMYGNERLLVATGYMGAGLTHGFLAGRCLAELIIGGTSSILPRRLWPERLRHLST